MRVLFVYPNLVRQENISLGLASLSALLRLHGHETFLVDYTWGGDRRTLLRAVAETRPHLIGFSVKSGEFAFCCHLASALKQSFPGIPVLFGGVHPTVSPEEVLEKDEVDMICVGEGELALVELLAGLQDNSDLCQVKNIWVKKEGSIVRNPLRPLVARLDELPFPDRALFDTPRYVREASGAIDVMSSRGCPFTCSYCINHVQQELYCGLGRFVRQRSVSNVLEELSGLRETYDCSFVCFQDDVFALRFEWVHEFCSRYPEEIGLPFVCNVRVENVTERVVAELQRAGCVSLNMGIESGSERIRRRVLNRQVSDERIITAFEVAHRHGLRTYSFNMVGLPYETKADLQKTIALNRKVRPSTVQVSVFQPYPGTKLHQACLEQGWLREQQVPFSHQMDSVLKYPALSRRELSLYKRTFKFRVLWKYKPVKAIFALVLDLFYERFIRMRDRLPGWLKRIMYAIGRR